MWEIVVFGIVFYVIFRDLIGAKAEELLARARMIDLEIEIREHDFHNDGTLSPGEHPGEDSLETREIKSD
jgi:hypothetical protein